MRYDNIPESARLAINRMTAVTEKEKRLFLKALDATVNAATSSPGIDDQATTPQIVITDSNVELNAPIDYEIAAAPTWTEGRVYYDEDEHALSYYNEVSEVTINLGQESVLRVRNATGAQINNGAVVYVSGSTGEVPQITKALSSPTHQNMLGVTTHDIGNNEFGYVTTFGIVRGIDTNAFTAGDTVYLSDSVAGDITATPPAYPNEVVEIGTVIKKSATGKLFVSINHKYLHAVVEDESPVLGGDLDFDGNSAVGADFSSAATTFSHATGSLLGRTNDTGVLQLMGGTSLLDGASIILGGQNNGTRPGDLEFFSLDTELYFTVADSEWDFQDNDITTTGDVTGNNLVYLSGNQTIGGNKTFQGQTTNWYQVYFAEGGLTTTGQFYIYASNVNTPVIQFADGDSLSYRRTDDEFAYRVGYTDVLTIGANDADFTSLDIVTTGDNVQGSGSHIGYKIGDATTNDWGWRDLEGPIVVRGIGGSSPTWAQISATGMWDYQFAVNNECWINFHLPHDYVPGTGVYIHAHWLTDGVQTNTVKWQWDYGYADGYDVQAFPLTGLATITAESAASGTAFTHHITESALISGTGWEVDGMLKVHLKRITNGGTENTDGVFLLTSDIHYQSSNVPTKNKNPNFYT